MNICDDRCDVDWLRCGVMLYRFRYLRDGTFQRQAIDSRLCRTTRQRGYIYDHFFFHSLRSILGRRRKCMYIWSSIATSASTASTYLPYFQKVVCVGKVHYILIAHMHLYVASTTKMADRYLFLFPNKNNLYRPHNRGKAKVVLLLGALDCVCGLCLDRIFSKVTRSTHVSIFLLILIS